MRNVDLINKNKFFQMEVDDFCCSTFEDWLTDAGRKGFSVVPDKYEGNYFFMLQCRNFDPDDGTQKQFIGQQAIQYCPFCGTKLSYTLERKRGVVETLYQHNKQFLI